MNITGRQYSYGNGVSYAAVPYRFFRTVEFASLFLLVDWTTMEGPDEIHPDENYECIFP